MERVCCIPRGVALATGLMLDELLCDPEFGVVDLPVGVVGFSSFLFVDGVLEFDEPPLLGLSSEKKSQAWLRRRRQIEKKPSLFLVSLLRLNSRGISSALSRMECSPRIA